MIPITKKASYKIEVWHSDESQENLGFKPCNFINMTLTFQSEYGVSHDEFRYDKRNKLVEIGTQVGWSTAFKNSRFKILSQCLYMSQTRFINRLIATAKVEMSYVELPF